MFMDGPVYDQGFTCKSTGRREGGYGKGPDGTEDQGPRHGFIKPAQVCTPAFSRHVENRTRRHPEQRLVDNVAKRVGHRAI